jgi:GAF domain-containing protein
MELGRRNVELALLNRVITAASSAHDPVELLSIVCRELAGVFGSPQAGAALLNEEQTSLTVVAEFRSEGRPSSIGHIIPVAGNLATQHVLKHRQPLPIGDVLNDSRMASVHHLMEERGTLSMLIVPLLARDEVIGTIGLDLIEVHEFTDDEIRLAFNLALSTAQSLATARMMDQIQVTLAELQRVLSRGQRINLLKDGAFIGEMELAADKPAVATVKTITPSRIMAWPATQIRQLLIRNPSMNSTIQTIFTADLMQKLQRSATSQA